MGLSYCLFVAVRELLPHRVLVVLWSVTSSALTTPAGQILLAHVPGLYGPSKLALVEAL
jgi:hypothetical protein